MDILKRIDQAFEKNEQINKGIAEHQGYIQELQQEALKLQGEYRLLVEMGQAQGILDEKGQKIELETSE